MHKKDEIILFKSITAGDYEFRLEEFWEEDDAGYCVSDFVLSKHTRLSVYDKSGRPVKEFDLDSREYDKDMVLQDNTVCVTWHPAYDREQTTRIDISTLQER